MVNAQEYINKNFPKNSKTINITNKSLTGSLDLREYPNLEELVIEINQITDLVFSENNKNITKIEAYDNKLTSLNFLTSLPNPEKVKWLGLFQNQITSSDLEVFSPFVNCEMLSIGRNNIRGSLISLRYWTKLKRLDMAGIKPQILGLEYITHNPFDGANGVFGEFFQDYGPRNIQEFNNNTWRGLRSGFRKLADEKVCETITNLRKQVQQLKQKQIQDLNELSSMVLPNSHYNFADLKQEITRLKYQELAPQVRNERTKFEQLVTNAKTKAKGSEKTIDSLLKAHQKREQTNEISQKDKLTGKIEAYQEILSDDGLSNEEIQNLLTKQTELQQLEEHLNNLQANTQQLEAKTIQAPRN